MSFRGLVALLVPLKVALAHTIKTSSHTPRPTTKSHVRRSDNVPIPTYTIGPKSNYFPTTVSDPEPTGKSLQIYPTGVYDDFPDEGITIVFGPELQQQIKDAWSEHCDNELAEECRKALSSTFETSDVTTHVKRFVVAASALFVAAVALIAAQVILVFNQPPGREMKFGKEALHQISYMAKESTFAVVADATASPATMTVQPPAASTPTTFISIETLTSASDGHDVGDVLHRIPEHTAERIQDFLGMTGLQETQRICEGQNLKRADTAECSERILRHAMDLTEAGPEGLIQLAQANIPVEPEDGQAIDFPIPSITVEEFLAFVQAYRRMFRETSDVREPDQNWDPIILYRSAVGLTIATHAAMFAGKTLLEIFVKKEDLVNDLKKEDLVCPKDLVCLLDNCQGQKEKTEFLTGRVYSDVSMTPICTTPKNYGCRCGVVHYPHVFEVQRGLMDEQYQWLEELIRLSELPEFDPKCEEEQTHPDPKARLRDEIELACDEHPFFLKTWIHTHDKDGLEIQLTWQKDDDDDDDEKCEFDCRDVFEPFLDSDCITDVGFSKVGSIKTNCGTALMHT